MLVSQGCKRLFLQIHRSLSPREHSIERMSKREVGGRTVRSSFSCRRLSASPSLLLPFPHTGLAGERHSIPQILEKKISAACFNLTSITAHDSIPPPDRSLFSCIGVRSLPRSCVWETCVQVAARDRLSIERGCTQRLLCRCLCSPQRLKVRRKQLLRQQFVRANEAAASAVRSADWTRSRTAGSVPRVPDSLCAAHSSRLGQ